MSEFLSGDFWQERYTTGTTGWDMGTVSPPLKTIIDALPDKHARILIPGCGNAWEARYLVEQGFTQVTVIDIAPAPVEALQQALGQENQQFCQVILGDFFQHEGQYDVILEQTFFCAINPELRIPYAEKMKSLLAQNGILTGVLFRTPFENPGPPFGGTLEEYQATFEPYLHIETMELCTNSHPKRAGNELLIRLRKV
ncbi:MAG TPA: methyltransferase domain-containing protein [Chitinophagales bacterium]|nr:methyltransferase domain-containing protein [Chitinophagales bacterium]